MNHSHSPSHIAVLCCAALLAIGVTACREKGPAEQLGEEVDEAVDTAKHGEESLPNKADDAVDELREGAKDAADEVKQK